MYSHGAIKQTERTCKKTPCDMRDSACSWTIFHKYINK